MRMEDPKDRRDRELLGRLRALYPSKQALLSGLNIEKG